MPKPWSGHNHDGSPGIGCSGGAIALAIMIGLLAAFAAFLAWAFHYVQ